MCWVMGEVKADKHHSSTSSMYILALSQEGLFALTLSLKYFAQVAKG